VYYIQYPVCEKQFPQHPPDADYGVSVFIKIIFVWGIPSLNLGSEVNSHTGVFMVSLVPTKQIPG
jgi:hypothetical protein